MVRTAMLALCLGGLLLVPAAGAREAGVTRVEIARLLSPTFGYAVSDSGPPWFDRLDLYADGGWHRATPPHLVGAIEDVAFVDRRHGWVESFDCGAFRMHLYRTSDGGRSWQASEPPAEHSCGGGPSYLSFTDAAHGWLEPVSPNGPTGGLWRTDDGGRTWRDVAYGLWAPGTPKPGMLACLGPISFVSPTAGWQAMCAGPVRTDDGGRIWRPVRVAGASHAPSVAGLPRLFGRAGAVAIELETNRGRSRAVEIAASHDGGRSFAVSAVVPTGYCPASPWARTLSVGQLRGAVVGPGVWWVFGSSGGRPTLHVTGDAGASWHAEHSSGLPRWPCSLVAVSAATPRDAFGLVTATPAAWRQGITTLARTADGGRSWQPVRLP